MGVSSLHISRPSILNPTSMDVSVLTNICRQLPVKMAADVFGQTGSDSVFQIMETLWKVFGKVEPERLRGPVVVYRRISEEGQPIDRTRALADFGVLAQTALAGFTLQIDDQGRAYVHEGTVSTKEISRIGVVYVFESGQEWFLAGERRELVPALDPTALSQFSIPTFRKLRDALEHYAIECIRDSSCPIFTESWKDHNRLFFKPKPEKLMRRSLEWFLKVRLGGDYEVRPEQIMDESHPVDIKVTHTFSNRRAIIEIKWLGNSLGDEGKFTARHRDDQARRGAQQLADYLDENRAKAPLHVTQGYYVIVDARREGLSPTTTELSPEQGRYYAELEVNFDPKFDEVREDFETPYRMFAEPIVTPN
jgi:hypothetical protein